MENPVDDPVIRPSMNAVAKTYELAHLPEHEDLMTAASHLTGKRINRFTHIHQSVEDLIKKSKMARLLGRETGCCFQRCVGMDSLNTLSIVTYNIDRKRGTGYYQRFLDSLHYVQEGDLTCDGAMTDPKGDRSLPPHQQHDPDRYLRVVEEREDGIVVRGAKAHQTGALWPLLANVHKHNVTRYPYEIARLAQDVAGGLMVTMPSEADFNSVDTAKWLEKNLGTNPGVSTMNRMRILRLIENPTLGSREVDISPNPCTAPDRRRRSES